MGAVIAAQEFVVIAGHIDDAGALARLAQKLLHHVVVRLRPVEAGLQRPAVDDVADQIDRVGLVEAQKVEQLARLAAARAEMNVGDEERAEMPRSVDVITFDAVRNRTIHAIVVCTLILPFDDKDSESKTFRIVISHVIASTS